MSFSNAKFGDEPAYFDDAEFGSGDVEFESAIFGKGASFTKVNFGDGMVDFECASFNYRKKKKEEIFVEIASLQRVDEYRPHDIDFFHAQFGKGAVRFERVYFGVGDVYFDGVDFGKGVTSFKGARFIQSKADFSGIVADTLEFSESRPIDYHVTGKETEELTFFSLRGATIDGPLYLCHLSFKCIPDLRSTKLSHHVDIDGLQVEFAPTGIKDWKTLYTNVYGRPQAEAKYRRLKEIAEQFKDHRQALRFNQYEFQAARWKHGENIRLSVILDVLYATFSNYGQSLNRPIGALAASMFLFTILYLPLSKMPQTVDLLFQLFNFSLSNSIPFLSGSGLVRKSGLEGLFCDEGWKQIVVHFLMIMQGTVSVLLVFLIGLGLRNRFRI